MSKAYLKGSKMNSTENRVNALRNMPADKAQKELWEWFKELGKKNDWDTLSEIYKLGKVPATIKGSKEGLLLGDYKYLPTNKFITKLLNVWLSFYCPWIGKVFNGDGTGFNLFTKYTKWTIVPFITQDLNLKPYGKYLSCLNFENKVGKGVIEPFMDVQILDYSVRASEATTGVIPSRKLRDEVVEIIPEIYLARQLINEDKTGAYHTILYFSMRPLAS
jgi:hypothetical protein